LDACGEVVAVAPDRTFFFCKLRAKLSPGVQRCGSGAAACFPPRPGGRGGGSPWCGGGTVCHQGWTWGRRRRGSCARSSRCG